MGDSVAEVAANLFVLGKLYDERMDSDEFYIVDRVHTALTAVYDGPYPIHKILEMVISERENIQQRWKNQRIHDFQYSLRLARSQMRKGYQTLHVAGPHCQLYRIV